MAVAVDPESPTLQKNQKEDEEQKEEGVDGDIHPPNLNHLQIFAKFLSFGCRAFGGPMAQIAMMKARDLDVLFVSLYLIVCCV